MPFRLRLPNFLRRLGKKPEKPASKHAPEPIFVKGPAPAVKTPANTYRSTRKPPPGTRAVAGSDKPGKGQTRTRPSNPAHAKLLGKPIPKDSISYDSGKAIYTYHTPRGLCIGDSVLGFSPAMAEPGKNTGKMFLAVVHTPHQNDAPARFQLTHIQEPGTKEFSPVEPRQMPFWHQSVKYVIPITKIETD